MALVLAYVRTTRSVWFFYRLVSSIFSVTKPKSYFFSIQAYKSPRNSGSQMHTQQVLYACDTQIRYIYFLCQCHQIEINFRLLYSEQERMFLFDQTTKMQELCTIFTRISKKKISRKSNFLPSLIQIYVKVSEHEKKEYLNEIKYGELGSKFMIKEKSYVISKKLR